MKTTATMMVLAAAVALSGCGGSSEPAASLNPAFAGTWTGNTLVTVPGVTSFSYPSQLDVAVTGATATITGVCPDGSGSVAATGSGNSAAWTGTLTCQPAAVGSCAAVTATLKSASGSLSADGTTLTALAGGTGTGCSFTFNATLSFTGTK